MDSEYCIVSVVMENSEQFEDTSRRFEELVSTKMREGWVVSGGINVVYNTSWETYRMSQALTRKKKSD